jgi:hypothetical protein
LNDLHDLLLIHDETIGLTQDFFEIRVIVLRLLPTMLDVRVVDVSVRPDWAGSNQCDSGNQLLELRGSKLVEVFTL